MGSTGEYHPDADGGRLLAGRYRIAEQLGRGGMGVVCRAVDEVLGREVAVKELRTYSDAAAPELADLRLRMRREARAAARVRHPGVVAVHDIAEHEGRPVIVMELVDGPSLDDVLREQGTLDPARAAGIGAEVLEALSAAHRAGVLHRDVKPGNILLERGGRVVLTDFGIAAVEDPGDGSTTRLTGTGELIGSLDYLAPERARGDEPGPASDVWSLGATLYAAVEGVSPFRRTSTWSTLAAIVAEPLPEPRHAGPLAPALAELMDKDPQRRADAARAGALLRAVAAGQSLPDGGGTARLAAAGTGTGPDAPVDPGVDEHSAPPGGFGPPPASGGSGPPPGPDPYGPSPAGGGPEPRRDGTGLREPGTDRRTVRTRSGPVRSGRRRGVVVAAVLAVLAAGAGGLYAVVGAGDGEEPGKASAEPGGRTTAGTGSPGERADDGDGRRDKAGDGKQDAKDRKGGKDGEPETERDDPPGGTTPAPDRPESSAPPSPRPGGVPGGSGGGPGGSGDSGKKKGCRSIGGGKYNCTVWETAGSYTKDHRRVGTLNSGTSYFFCQSRLGFRETSGRWTNVWWAKTDDDSGNTGVWVNDVHILGGANDGPVPGLPMC